jgi:hypothetical protein
MTGVKERLDNPVRYGGSKHGVIANNSKHSIAHIGDVVFSANNNKKDLVLNNVYHVSGLKKNLLSVPQITETDHYVVFRPEDVKVCEHFETSSKAVLQGHRE